MTDFEYTPPEWLDLDVRASDRAANPSARVGLATNQSLGNTRQPVRISRPAGSAICEGCSVRRTAYELAGHRTCRTCRDKEASK